MLKYERLYFNLRYFQPGSRNAYLLAAVLVATGTALRVALGSKLPGVQFISLFPAVIATTLVCGVEAGVFAVAMATICAWYFLLPPTFSFRLESIQQVYVLAFFVCVASVIVTAIGGMRQAIEQVRRLNLSLDTLNQTLTATFEANPDGILLVDHGGHITSANQRAADLFGSSREALTGTPIAFLLPERFRDRHAVHRERYMKDPQLRSMGSGQDLLALRRDGTEFPAQIQIGPLGVRGEIQIIATVRDLTDERAMQSALAEIQKQKAVLEERQRNAERTRIMADAFDHAAIGIVICDPKSARFLAVNPAYANACGMTVEEVQATPTIDTCPEEDWPHFSELLAEADRLGQLTCQRRHIRKDGSVFPVEVAISSIKDPDGSVAYRVHSVSDITARNEIEREKEQQRHELEQSNTDLESFAYIISHDLKAPLRGIVHLSEWIREDIAAIANPETLSNLQLLLGRVARMQTLLEGLRTYSRLGRDHSESEEVDIADLVRDIVDLAPPPPGFAVIHEGSVTRIHTQRMPLRVVLDNLIGNGLKHHDRSEGRIVITTRLVDEATEFRVRDDGPGIAPRFHQRIFEIFQTLASRDDVEASGMGLAIVKKLVEGHGGRIGVESNPPARGTSFVFTWQNARRADHQLRPVTPVAFATI
jgi:PAS domain S-box-containing protein